MRQGSYRRPLSTVQMRAHAHSHTHAYVDTQSVGDAWFSAIDVAIKVP